MKLFSISLFVVLALPSLFAFQAHNQNLAYTHPAIVVSNTVSYVSAQNVPAGTTITSTTYWTPLLGTAPSTDPGTPPTTEPSTSDSNLSNLTPPAEDNVTVASRFLGISTRGPVSKTVGMTGAVAVTGSGTKKVAFMAKGTTMLATDDTINVVKDPKMIIWQNDGSGWTVLGENDNHADASSSQNISTVSGKEGITLPSGVNEAAIVVDVQPGVSYAAIVTEQDTTIGDTEVREAIVEAYEITE